MVSTLVLSTSTSTMTRTRTGGHSFRWQIEGRIPDLVRLSLIEKIAAVSETYLASFPCFGPFLRQSQRPLSDVWMLMAATCGGQMLVWRRQRSSLLATGTPDRHV